MPETLVYDLSSAGYSGHFYIIVIALIITLKLSVLVYLAREVLIELGRYDHFWSPFGVIVFVLVLSSVLVSGVLTTKECSTSKTFETITGEVSRFQSSGKSYPQNAHFMLGNKEFLISSVSSCGFIKSPVYFFDIKNGQKLKIHYQGNVIFKIYEFK